MTLNRDFSCHFVSPSHKHNAVNTRIDIHVIDGLCLCVQVLAAMFELFACVSDSRCQHFCLYMQLELKSATSVCAPVCVLV